MADKKPRKKAAPPKRKSAKQPPPNSPGDRKGFNQRARLFAEHYAVHGVGVQAAIAAGYSKRSATQQAADLMKHPEVIAHLERIRAKATEKAGIDGAEVLKRLEQIAEADPNELSQVRRVCCRYCHGEGHRYQFTPKEWRNKAAGDEDRPPATWYDKRKPPNPDCPECFGDGEEEIFLQDTRTLSENARRAYAGVTMTKNGPSIRMHDRAAVLLKLGEQAGLFSKKVELSGKNGGPIRTDQVLRIEFVKPNDAPPPPRAGNG